MTSLVQGGTGIRERDMLVEKQQTLDQGHWYPSYLVNLNAFEWHTSSYHPLLQMESEQTGRK